MKNCITCSKSLFGMKDASRRKYCSLDCMWKNFDKKRKADKEQEEQRAKLWASIVEQARKSIDAFLAPRPDPNAHKKAGKSPAIEV